MQAVSNFGKTQIESLVELGKSFEIFAQSIYCIATGKISRKEFVEQASKFGFDTMPVVSMVCLFIGLALTLQISRQLMGIGNTSQIGTTAANAIVREIGPVISGVMIAARVGGAMAAEIATMKVTEQVDAIKMMKINPIAFLVAPRILAAILMTPILTIFAIYVGLVGGALIIKYYVNLDVGMYFDSFRMSVGNRDIIIALVKALMNGAIVSTISCNFGMRAVGGAAGVGETTTKSVVWAMIGIFLTNFLITNSVYSFGKVIDPAFVK